MPESWQPLHMRNQKDTDSAGLGSTKEPGGLGFKQSFIEKLAWIITFMWGLSIILDAISGEYEIPGSIHALMMVVAGSAFGTNFIQTNKGASKRNGD